MEFGIQFILM